MGLKNLAQGLVMGVQPSIENANQNKQAESELARRLKLAERMARLQFEQQKELDAYKFEDSLNKKLASASLFKEQGMTPENLARAELTGFNRQEAGYLTPQETQAKDLATRAAEAKIFETTEQAKLHGRMPQDRAESSLAEYYRQKKWEDTLKILNDQYEAYGRPTVQKIAIDPRTGKQTVLETDNPNFSPENEAKLRKAIEDVYAKMGVSGMTGLQPITVPPVEEEVPEPMPVPGKPKLRGRGLGAVIPGKQANEKVNDVVMADYIRQLKASLVSGNREAKLELDKLKADGTIDKLIEAGY
jgi:hypothetical protein